MSRLRRLFPFLSWPRPTAALMRGEISAGLSVGLMVIPQGVAYAALAGMPLVTGVYAALLPALVAVLFSASVRLSVGPTALSCLLVGTSLTGLAEPGSAQWVELAVWLALLTGLLQVGLGFIRFGWLLNLVSAPVLMAFTQGAAVLIIGSQIPVFLGLGVTWSQGLEQARFHLPSILFGGASLALLMLGRRWRPAFPTVLVVVLGSSWLSAWTGFEAAGGAVVGVLPSGLPTLYQPSLPELATLTQLLLPILSISLLSFLETASAAKEDNERSGQRWNQDQDLIGQGLGKIASGLCGSFPTSSSFSRSALILYAGARSGWATVVSVAVVLGALLLFMPLLRHVPQPVLGAIVLVAVLGLIKPLEFARLWRISRAEAAIAGLTLAITLVAAPQLHWGVLAGVLMSLIHFLYLNLHPRIIEVGLHADGSLRDRHLWKLAPLAPQLYALRMDAALDFATANGLERAITEYLSAHPQTRHVCLFAQPINHIDASGVGTFAKLSTRLQQRGITLHLSGIKLPVEKVLLRAGALTQGPGLRLYRADAEALSALAQLAPPTEAATGAV